MGADQAIGLMNSLLLTTMIVAGPVLAVAMIVGLVVSILQVATQLQEMTLSYIPKLVASALMLMLLGPWMIHRITEFAVRVISTIPAIAN